MTTWVHADVLDGGPAVIKASATKMLLISAYAAADSYATVVANKLAEATMTSADYTLSSSGSNRRLTTAAGKSATATAAAATPDLHFAFTDGASKVLWVTNETSDVAVAIGDTCNFPSLTYTSNQPS
jgi:hypothetical protein